MCTAYTWAGLVGSVVQVISGYSVNIVVAWLSRLHNLCTVILQSQMAKNHVVFPSNTLSIRFEGGRQAQPVSTDASLQPSTVADMCVTLVLVTLCKHKETF